MKRILYAVAAALIFASVGGASLMWPQFAVWPAWMIVALFIFTAHLLGDDVKILTANRDKWRTLAQKSEAERVSLERQLEQQSAELARLQSELTRLRAYADPRLFAAAGGVLTAWNGCGNEAIGMATEIERLREAVSRWGKAEGGVSDEA